MNNYRLNKNKGKKQFADTKKANVATQSLKKEKYIIVQSM